MAELVSSLTHLPPPGGVAPIRIDRFSPNFDQSKALGFRDVKPYPAYAHVYPTLNKDSLAAIAYYFTYEYEDGHDPAQYTQDLVQAVSEWKENFMASEMMYWEIPGGLMIWDQRGKNDPAVWVIKGTAKEVFLFCDQARSFKGVSAHLEQFG